jgi:AraC-like DNA-binding protein
MQYQKPAKLLKPFKMQQDYFLIKIRFKDFDDFAQLALRLNGVHRELKNADPISTTITDLANRWGFWHMSQFAADFRRFFGELPSATIGKTRLINRTG